MSNTYFKRGVLSRLAENIGVDYSTVQRWVSGEIIPDAKRAVELEGESAKLGLDIPAECWLLRARYPHDGLRTKEA